MDVERIETLANQLAAQAHAINTVIGVVDGTVGVLTGLWFGENFGRFHQSWFTGQRGQAQAAAVDIDGVITQLRHQIGEQRQASDGAGGMVSGVSAPGPSGYPRPANVSPKDFLAFAKDAETQSDNFFKTGNPGGHDALPSGWHPASAADYQKLGIDPESLHDPRTGLDVTIYSNGHGGYVVSYAGSMSQTGPDGLPAQIDPLNADWREDDLAAAGVPHTSAQTEQAMNLANQVAQAAGKDNVVFTGHSLGGREAALASVVTGSRAVTFNPTGTTNEDLVYANALAGRGENPLGMIGDVLTGGAVSHASADSGSHVTNYVMSMDIAQATHSSPAIFDSVGIKDPLAPANDYIGHTNVLLSDSADPFAQHDHSNFNGRV